MINFIKKTNFGFIKDKGDPHKENGNSEEIEILKNENAHLRSLLHKEIQTTYNLCVKYLRMKRFKDEICKKYVELEKEYNKCNTHVMTKLNEVQHEIRNTMDNLSSQTCLESASSLLTCEDQEQNIKQNDTKNNCKGAWHFHNKKCINNSNNTMHLKKLENGNKSLHKFSEVKMHKCKIHKNKVHKCISNNGNVETVFYDMNNFHNRKCHRSTTSVADHVMKDHSSGDSNLRSRRDDRYKDFKISISKTYQNIIQEYLNSRNINQTETSSSTALPLKVQTKDSQSNEHKPRRCQTSSRTNYIGANNYINDSKDQKLRKFVTFRNDNNIKIFDYPQNRCFGPLYELPKFCSHNTKTKSSKILERCAIKDNYLQINSQCNEKFKCVGLVKEISSELVKQLAELSLESFSSLETHDIEAIIQNIIAYNDQLKGIAKCQNDINKEREINDENERSVRQLSDIRSQEQTKSSESVEYNYKLCKHKLSEKLESNQLHFNYHIRNNDQIDSQHFSESVSSIKTTRTTSTEVTHTQSAPNIVQKSEFIKDSNMKRSISQISVRDMCTNTSETENYH
ncbi:hypothetical protein C0J52_08921 [Blattella germanica]|nr:hypothetical protein C0J52_08921 [Blattella germanica]